MSSMIELIQEKLSIAMLISRFLKMMFFVGVFSGIFYALGENANFERSIVFLMYIIFIHINRSDDSDRTLMAVVLILSYLKNNDDGRDESLSASTHFLLEALEADSVRIFVQGAAAKDILGDSYGRLFGEILQFVFLIIMFIWLIATYINTDNLWTWLTALM